MKKNLLKTIFSVENENLHKVTTILGVKFKVKNKYKELLSKIDSQDKLLKCQNAKLKIFENELNNIKILEKNINESNKKITKELTTIKSYIVEKPVQNIRKHLFNYAGMETARYIIENMPTVPYFKNKYELLTYALSKVTLEGQYLEFGVYSGNTINHISSTCPNVQVYGFDSFEGLPESWRSGFEKGAFAKDNLPPVNENVTLIKGWFDESVPEFVKDHSEQCAFIHVDCDIYSSTKVIFDNFKDKIKPGTIIVFDEYFNYPNWQEHEYKAFQEFIKDRNLNYRYLGYVYTLEQVAVEII